jgi:hypothetical protein
MNCDADKLATSFHERMDWKEVMLIQEGFSHQVPGCACLPKGSIYLQTFNTLFIDTTTLPASSMETWLGQCNVKQH